MAEDDRRSGEANKEEGEEEMIHPTIRYTNSGIPVLGRKQIDSIAEAYLADFRPQYLLDPQPVDVEKFAVEYLNYRQDIQYLSNTGVYLGMFVFSDTDMLEVYDEEKNEAKYISEKADTIVIDKSLLDAGQEGRYRFTMGHEIAHGIFHKPMMDPYQEYLSLFYEGETGSRGLIFRCELSERRIVDDPQERWTDEQWQEWQADAFSSSLLMPKSMVEQIAKEHNIDQKSLAAREMLIADVERTFEVSHTAAMVRLTNLHLLSPLEEKPVQTSPEDPEIVNKMRLKAKERAQMREVEDAVYDKRDEDLWNNVEPPRKRRKR